MDCITCESPEAALSTVRFSNGDRYRLYLCDRCARRFQYRRTIQSVTPVPVRGPSR